MKKVKSIILSIALLLTMLPIASTSVQAAGKELIINDSEVGTELNKFNFSTGWKESKGYPDRFYNGDEHWYNFSSCGYQEGDALPSYSIKFKGTGIELYGEKDSNLGIYNVYLDGEKIDEIDAYNSSKVSKNLLYSKKDISLKEHVLKVELSNTKNSASSSTDGEIDYAKILGVGENEEISEYSHIKDSLVTPTHELFKFQYAGNWKDETISLD